jgi:hypothetical protein
VKCPLLFGALVPYPVALNVPFGGYGESLYHVLYSSDEEMLKDTGVQQAGLKDRRALAAYFKKEDPKATRLAVRYRRNIQLYGHATFFTWYPDKWGPNHDLGDGKEWNLWIEQPSKQELVYYFETNWGVPDGWLMIVAKRFPTIEFSLVWEGAENEKTGLIRHRNGKQVQFVDRDMWLLDDDDPEGSQGSYLRDPRGPPLAPKGTLHAAGRESRRPRSADRNRRRRRALASERQPRARPKAVDQKGAAEIGFADEPMGLHADSYVVASLHSGGSQHWHRAYPISLWVHAHSTGSPGTTYDHRLSCEPRLS